MKVCTYVRIAGYWPDEIVEHADFICLTKKWKYLSFFWVNTYKPMSEVADFYLALIVSKKTVCRKLCRNFFCVYIPYVYVRTVVTQFEDILC